MSDIVQLVVREAYVPGKLSIDKVNDKLKHIGHLVAQFPGA
jgi:hypothetical protein